MRLNPLYAPDGMIGGDRCDAGSSGAGSSHAGSSGERFDDGLVHNHHWAVTADEAYPSQDQGSVTEYGRSSFEASDFQSVGTTGLAHDHHDDGLVHNHHWAVSGQ
jgi:hypothetical protein